MKKIKSEDKKTLAEFLKEKRQEKNLSLEKLSDLTKIQIYYLKALENNSVNELPPAIYRTGMFRRLAKFLDISESQIIDIYNNENPAVEQPPKKVSHFVLTPGKVTAFAGLALLVFILGYLWYQFDFLVGPPNLVIALKEDAIVSQDAIAITGRTDGDAALTINGEGVYISPEGNFSKDVRLTNGANIIEVKAVNKFGKTSEIIRRVFREAP